MKTIAVIFLVLCLLPFSSIRGQQNFDVNATDIAAGPGVLYSIGGQSFSRERFSNLEDGSPFFNEEFMKGDLILENGKLLKNFSIRLNLLDGTVNYLNEKNEELEASAPIREVHLTDLVNKKTYRFIHSKYLCNGSGKTWNRVIDTGAVSLYMSEVRVMTESKSYGSATLQQNILKDQSYLVVKGSDCTKIKTAGELANKLVIIDPSFQEKIAKQKVKGKSEKDLLELIKIYNATHQASANQ